MRIPRIFQDTELETGSTLSLDAHAHKHLIQVLRLTKNHPVIIFNGKGGEYKAQLLEANKKKSSVEILEHVDLERESSFHIHLAQCISKGERFELALQKAVELGVQEITPVFAMRSQLKLNPERKEKKQQHWKQVVVNAAEQSGRTRIPLVHEAIALPDFVETLLDSNICKLILEPDANKKLSSITPSHNYCLLIGPEGGFEDTELELATQKGFESVVMGKQTLRTETAPIAAIAALNLVEKEY